MAMAAEILVAPVSASWSANHHFLGARSLCRDLAGIPRES
jgi:hypothetical protein